MSPGRPSLLLGCLLATTGPVVSPAAASATTSPATSGAPVLDYVSEGGHCPGRDRFVAQVEEALDPSERSGVLAAPGTRIRVEIRAAIGGYRGTLEKVAAGEASAARVVVSPICAEVVQALALTAAFSLAPAAAAPAPPPMVVKRPVAVAALPARAPADAFWTRWSISVGPVAGGWLSPGLLAGIEGGGDRTFSGAGARFAGSLHLRAAYARNDWIGSMPDARFTLWTGTVEACGLARPAGGSLEIELCASGESGWLQARGVRIANPRTSDSLWLALGGGPRVRVALGPRWGVEMAGALRRPLQHLQFAFDDPEQQIARTPAVAWTAALAVSARFP